LISKWKKERNPVYDLIADDKVQHSVWIINDTDTIAKISKLFNEQVPCTYIADGHHRAASAAKVRKALGKKAPTGADIFLTTLFPSNQLRILDYNRVLKDLNGLSAAELLQKLEEKFLIEKVTEAVAPAQLHEFGLYVNKQWYKLTSREGTYSADPIGILDVTILQENVLDPLFD